VQRHGVTLRAMSTRRRRLDRRALRPRDYLDHPHEFGWAEHPTWRLPAGGDERSMRVAQVEHDVARLVRRHAGRHAAALLGARFGFSRSHWSDALHGHTWMGETLLAAAVAALLERPKRH